MTFEAAPSCGKAGTVDAPGVWYRITGTGRNVTASLCGSSFDSKLSVFTGDCGSLVCIEGNDDYCVLASAVVWFAAPGTDYFILVHGYMGSTGAYTLDVTCSDAPTPTPAPCCPGDANNSGGFVDAADFVAVQSFFGSSGPAGIPGDANCSGGFVDAADFVGVQINFGNLCP